MGLRKLEEIARKNPYELDNPICVVDGRVITLREAIEILRAGGDLARKVEEKLKELGLDPPQFVISEDAWRLAYERWKRKPEVRIVFRGRIWTKEDILREIRNRTEVGAYFVMLELGYLKSL